MTVAAPPETVPLVGIAETAEILGKKPPSVVRARDNGGLPQTVADLRSTSVWTREQIEAHRDGRIAPPGAARRLRRLRPVGTSEAADMLGVDKSQIARWRRADRNGSGPGFPEPYDELRAGPIWLRQAILVFARAR